MTLAHYLPIGANIFHPAQLEQFLNDLGFSLRSAEKIREREKGLFVFKSGVFIVTSRALRGEFGRFEEPVHCGKNSSAVMMKTKRKSELRNTAHSSRNWTAA